MSRMKMTDQDFGALKNSVENVFPTPRYDSMDEMKEHYDELGKSMERMRWDIFRWVYRENNKLYNYLNDNHIDTALRRITNTKKGE